MFHLFGWKLAEAGSDDHKVGFGKGFEAWDVIINSRGDKAGFGVNREKNGAVKAMVLGEDFAELGKGFFGAIFFIAPD